MLGPDATGPSHKAPANCCFVARQEACHSMSIVSRSAMARSQAISNCPSLIAQGTTAAGRMDHSAPVARDVYLEVAAKCSMTRLEYQRGHGMSEFVCAYSLS